MNSKKITIKAFIGSNNKTKELEIDKITSILSKNHDGFTIDYPKIGFWKGQKEDTAIVYLSDEELRIQKTFTELKKELDQEAIAYQEDSELKLI